MCVVENIQKNTSKSRNYCAVDGIDVVCLYIFYFKKKLYDIKYGEYSEEYLEIAKLLCAVDGIDVVIIIIIYLNI